MEFSLKDLKELIGQNSQESPFKIGDKVLIRTISFYYTGKVIEITGGFVKLDNACWIADTGRFSDSLIKEEFSEVEPYVKPANININSIIDYTYLDTLPSKQK